MRTGSSSLNFFQAVFISVVTVIPQPPPAESMSPIEIFERKIVNIFLPIDVNMSQCLKI